MEVIFKKYDKDGSGYLNTHEFTEALQLMDYKYNERFVEEVLKLVFDDEWESKQNNLLFLDFLTFMSEFEPVHYQVLDRIEAKLKLKKLQSVSIQDPRITGLLQHIEMKDGALLLHRIDPLLDALRQSDDTTAPTPQASSAPTPVTTLKLQSPFIRSPLLSPTLPAITESDADPDPDPNLSQKGCVLPMSTQQLQQWINTDTAFDTSMIRRECCGILEAQRWDGNDMLQALRLTKLDEILLLFKSLQNYEYLVRSLCKLKPSDVNCKQLVLHLESIKQQPVAPDIPTEPQVLESSRSSEPQAQPQLLSPQTKSFNVQSLTLGRVVH